VILHRRFANSSALSERVLEVDGNAVLPEQIAKGFVRQFLKIRHPVARELLELIEGIIIEGDQFAHDRPASCIASMRFNNDRWKSFRLGTGSAAQITGLSPDRCYCIGRQIQLAQKQGRRRSMTLTALPARTSNRLAPSGDLQLVPRSQEEM
jgi:hypothetical protein